MQDAQAGLQAGVRGKTNTHHRRKVVHLTQQPRIVTLRKTLLMRQAEYALSEATDLNILVSVLVGAACWGML